MFCFLLLHFVHCDGPFDLVCVCLYMQEKFPEADSSHVTSLIGGFFLLRFLNPAIVTPNGIPILLVYRACS